MKPTRAWLFEEYVVKEKSIERMSNEHGVNIKTMTCWLKQANVPLRPPGTRPRGFQPLTARKEAQILQLLWRGLTPDRIAKETGVWLALVENIVRELDSPTAMPREVMVH